MLKSLLDEDLDVSFRKNPIAATIRGVPGYDHRLPEVSLEALAKHREHERRTLERLRTIDPAALAGQDRISYEILRDKMELAVEGHAFRDADGLALSTLGGLQTVLPRAAQVTPFKTVENYRDYLKRIQAMPAMVAATIERLGLGLKSGWMHPKPVLDRVVKAIDAHLVEDPAKSVLLAPFAKMPDLAAEAQRAVDNEYQPALRRFKAFIAAEYRPKAPDIAGLASYPGGAAYYEHLIRARIIHGKSAKEIHETGLSEVKRIRGEMDAIAKEVGFKGTTDAFIEFLRTDKQFFFESAEAVLAAHRAMAPRVDPQLPKLFHKVPRMPYAVRAMTAAEAASSTAANYQVGSLKLGTSAYFTINANGYEHEAKWRTETLFLHEAVPGHHLQNARAAEIEGLHPWRSAAVWNIGYGEGWALYAERLGYDLGFFTDPYMRYGNLQAQLFRAARLVVDTGIHAYNWPRDKAIEYMGTQGGSDRGFAVSEVDRYFSNPSQALGYLLGFHKMLELRGRAEKALGAKFDVKDFHAVVVDNGSMPLKVLERQVDAWLARGGGALPAQAAAQGAPAG
jgi:uncharacterized protein (DUF885 family)